MNVSGFDFEECLFLLPLTHSLVKSKTCRVWVERKKRKGDQTLRIQCLDPLGLPEYCGWWGLV